MAGINRHLLQSPTSVMWVIVRLFAWIVGGSAVLESRSVMGVSQNAPTHLALRALGFNLCFFDNGGDPLQTVRSCSFEEPNTIEERTGASTLQPQTLSDSTSAFPDFFESHGHHKRGSGKRHFQGPRLSGVDRSNQPVPRILSRYSRAPPSARREWTIQLKLDPRFEFSPIRDVRPESPSEFWMRIRFNRALELPFGRTHGLITPSSKSRPAGRKRTMNPGGKAPQS